MKHKVKLRVLSSFVEVSGTDVVEERNFVESTCISGIADNQNEVRITVKGIPNQVGMVAEIFGSLAQNSIPLDMIVQNQVIDGRVDLTFTLRQSDLERAQHVLKDLQKKLPFSHLEIDPDIVKISVIGIGMRSNLEMGSLLFKTLADHNIAIQLITTSEIKISVILDKQHTDLAVNALHQAFQLERG